MAKVQPFSLRRKLTTRIVLWQTATLLALAAGVLFIELFTDTVHPGRINPNITKVLAEAVQSTPSGLILAQTKGIAELRSESPGLWFVVQDQNGRQLSEGSPPASLVGLPGLLAHLDEVEISGSDAGVSSAVMHQKSSAVGEVKVLVGGVRPLGFGYTFVEFAATEVLPMVMLIVSVLCMMTLIAVPRMVESALSGLRLAVQRAAVIDIDKRGTRLPLKDVPAEIAELVVAMNDALERLDQGYMRQERFLADAAHELKTPIAILHNRIELLPPGTEGGNRLLLDVQRIANLAEQLLDLQRLDHQHTSPGSIDLVALCRQITADLAPIAINSGYEPVFKHEASTVMVNGDASAIERAVINLFQNAIAHGGGSGTIHISVLADSTIEIADDGPGIPLDRREWIFEPFHRLKPLDRGSGLGLSLVREIMRRHAGSVTVEASDSGGACFTLRFPKSNSDRPLLSSGLLYETAA